MVAHQACLLGLRRRKLVPLLIEGSLRSPRPGAEQAVEETVAAVQQDPAEQRGPTGDVKYVDRTGTTVLSEISDRTFVLGLLPV